MKTRTIIPLAFSICLLLVSCNKETFYENTICTSGNFDLLLSPYHNHPDLYSVPNDGISLIGGSMTINYDQTLDFNVLYNETESLSFSGTYNIIASSKINGNLKVLENQTIKYEGKYIDYYFICFTCELGELVFSRK